MRIICIADTHKSQKLMHPIPQGDVLIYAGDDDWNNLNDVKKFNKWLKTIKIPHKIVIAGNHDFYAEQPNSKVEKYLTEAIYLKSSGCVINGIKFWGSPYTPIFMNWAFNRYHTELAEEWRKIPNDTEVLITHGPPYGILDMVLSPHFDSHVGDRALEYRVFLLPNLKYHIFGHIHCEYGMIMKRGITFINASLCNEVYAPVNKPIEVEI